MHSIFDIHGYRGVSGRWAMAHPDFGQLEGSPHYYLPIQFLVATYAPGRKVYYAFYYNENLILDLPVVSIYSSEELCSERVSQFWLISQYESGNWIFLPSFLFFKTFYQGIHMYRRNISFDSHQLGWRTI